MRNKVGKRTAVEAMLRAKELYIESINLPIVADDFEDERELLDNIEDNQLRVIEQLIDTPQEKGDIEEISRITRWIREN